MQQSDNRLFDRAHRLLVVDDEEVIRDLFGIQLRREGYAVSMAGSAQQALEVLATERIDLVLLDMKLPDMSGLVLLQKLRQTYSILDLPIIIISGAGHRDDIVAGLQSGANTISPNRSTWALSAHAFKHSSRFTISRKSTTSFRASPVTT